MDESQYELLLDEATRACWSQTKEEGDPLGTRREQYLNQLAQEPTKTMPILLQAIRQPDPFRCATAIAVIDLIGSPENNVAIPELLYEIGADDWNSPAWTLAAQALSHLGPDIVVPHLLRALLEKGEPYHHLRGSETTWYEDIEGLMLLLCRTPLGDEYALRCSPAVHFLLTQTIPGTQRDLQLMESLLDLVEKVGTAASFMLPTLLALFSSSPTTEVGRRVHKLVFSFPQEILQDYTLLLPEDYLP